MLYKNCKYSVYTCTIHSFIEIDHKIFSMVILSLPLIKKVSFQFLVKKCAQVLVHYLED